MPSKNKAGILDASLTFVGLVLASYNLAQLKPTIATTIETITLTGSKSVSVSLLTATSMFVPGDSTSVKFKVSIPVTLKASKVEAILAAARRTVGQLSAALIVNLAQNNLTVPANLTSTSFSTVTIVEPISTAGQVAYACPFPKNCIPANNESLCAEGATGPACAQCTEGYALSGKTCISCSGKTGDANTWIAVSVLLVVALACIAFVILPYLGYPICGTEEETQVEEEAPGQEQPQLEAVSIELVQTIQDRAEGRAEGDSSTSQWAGVVGVAGAVSAVGVQGEAEEVSRSAGQVYRSAVDAYSQAEEVSLKNIILI